MSFTSFNLDSRLLRALNNLNFEKPTMIQCTAIPLALEGRDILGRAKTGSGKTIAYLIPVIEKIFRNQKSGIQALILVPTKELTLQVTMVIKNLLIYCPDVKVMNISNTEESESFPLLHVPEIIVSTPAKISSHIQDKNIILEDSLESLVIDEADLILSFGYDEDVGIILKNLPQIYQSFLMSATLSAEVLKLKALVLRNPATIEMEEKLEDDMLYQYYVNCLEFDKYLLLLFLLKLKVHPFGSHKTIIFVNSIDKCYKLKLFLEQFGISSCTLNSELPVKSRFHIIQEFNRGVYDFIIATDNIEVSMKSKNNQNVEGKDDCKQKKSKRFKSDKEFGISRGIDFQNAFAVINFDMPSSSSAYQHRVGRTARGLNNKGYALSFVKTKVQNDMTDIKILEKIQLNQKELGKELIEFKFDMSPVESFRYRCVDALRSVTDLSIRNARIKELKTEILNSEKLKAHFEDHPTDLAFLRHDKVIQNSKIKPQLRRIPDYLMPKGKVSITTGDFTSHVPFKMANKKSKKLQKSKSQKRKQDPLKCFRV